MAVAKTMLSYAGSAQWFDANAVTRWSEVLNGQGVGVISGAQGGAQEMLRTAFGTWILHSWSVAAGAKVAGSDTYVIQTQAAAQAWMVSNTLTPVTVPVVDPNQV